MIEFSEAVIWLKRGHRLARESWGGDQRYIILMECPGRALTYIKLERWTGPPIMWRCTTDDLLAEDWKVV